MAHVELYNIETGKLWGAVRGFYAMHKFAKLVHISQLPLPKPGDKALVRVGSTCCTGQHRYIEEIKTVEELKVPLKPGIIAVVQLTFSPSDSKVAS